MFLFRCFPRSSPPSPWSFVSTCPSLSSTNPSIALLGVAGWSPSIFLGRLQMGSCIESRCLVFKSPPVDTGFYTRDAVYSPLVEWRTARSTCSSIYALPTEAMTGFTSRYHLSFSPTGIDVGYGRILGCTVCYQPCDGVP